MAFCPSEMIPLTGTGGSRSLTSRKRVTRSPWALRSPGPCQQRLLRKHIADDPEDFVTSIWLQPIDRQDHSALLAQDVVDALPIPHMHRHQFFIPLDQMGDAAFGHLDTSSAQFLMDFRHTAMLPKPQHSH